MTTRITGRRAGITAALTLAPLAAWRFAHAYRARAGYPRQHRPVHDPSALGLAFERGDVPTVDDIRLPGWWIPADGGAAPPAASAPAPAVLLVHGWESARDRTLPNALVTPHVANPQEAHDAALAERVTANVRRLAAGEPLLGVIDPEAGF